MSYCQGCADRERVIAELSSPAQAKVALLLATDDQLRRACEAATEACENSLVLWVPLFRKALLEVLEEK